MYKQFLIFTSKIEYLVANFNFISSKFHYAMAKFLHYSGIYDISRISSCNLVSQIFNLVAYSTF